MRRCSVQTGVRRADKLESDLRVFRCARQSTVDEDLNSISAMTPDPNTLMAINANACTSDAPLITISICKSRRLLTSAISLMG